MGQIHAIQSDGNVVTGVEVSLLYNCFSLSISDFSFWCNVFRHLGDCMKRLGLDGFTLSPNLNQ